MAICCCLTPALNTKATLQTSRALFRSTDVTRNAQREIYDLVLKAQMSCVEMVRPGVTHDQLKQHSIEVLTEGMVELGLLKGKPEELIKEKKYEKFYMHGLGHMLGIDVHDVGRYYFGQESRALEPGVVMTVEPGIYIAPDTKDVPEKYLGIGVRIEDDVLCTNNGPRVLTTKVPKHAEEIEALMRPRINTDFQMTQDFNHVNPCQIRVNPWSNSSSE